MIKRMFSLNVLRTQFFFLLLSLTFVQPAKSQIMPATTVSYFIENLGQFKDMDGNAVPSVLFTASVPNIDIFITKKGLTLLFLKPILSNDSLLNEKVWHWERMDIELDNAVILAENVYGYDTAGCKLNYFNELVPLGVAADGFGKVVIKNIYEGIDWEILLDDETGLKYNFILAPGINAAAIKLIYNSNFPITLDDDGNININTIIGNITELAPTSYETISGINILSNFELQQINEHKVAVNFHLNEYDNDVSVTIDPQLYWCTYFGGNKEECFNSVTTDADGNLIVVGWTDSPGFPTLNAGTFYQGAKAPLEDAMIVKFSPTEALLWATFYGGNKEEWAYSVTTDGSNNIFVSGETVSPNFPVYNAGTFYQAALTGDEDVFILKFDASGSRMWATYYGGDKKEGGYGITTDPSGNIFVTGYTESTDFPKLNAGTFYQAAMGGVQDAFILKFNNAGTRIWATYYGGSLYDVGNSIASDGSGNIFVTGETRSTNFPIYDAGTFYQNTMAGDTDLYVLKFTNTGARQWATYYGGLDADYGNSVITDVSDNIYVGGWTRSNNFPTADAGYFYQSVLSGISDGQIIKFDNTGNRLWATYLGGNSNESAHKWDILAEDFCGNIYFAITTASTDMPVYDAGCSSYYDDQYEDFGDIFITRFTDYGLITWATYYGYDNEELDACIGVSQLDGKSLYMTGQYNEYDPGAAVPLEDPGGTAYYDGTHNGDNEAFIGKFVAVPLNITTENSNFCFCIDTAVAIPDCGVEPYSYLWSDGQTTAIATGLCPDVYTVTVTDADCNINVASIDIVCALPVDVTEFTAVQINNFVRLNWSVSSQLHTEFYLLEKSLDGEIFIPVGQITAKGNSTEMMKYTFDDYGLQTGTWYYKLSSIDDAGDIVEKGIIPITVTSLQNSIEVITSDNNGIEIVIHVICDLQSGLQIIDLNGATIYYSDFMISSGANTLTLNLPNLSSGIYFIKINFGTEYLAEDFYYFRN